MKESVRHARLCSETNQSLLTSQASNIAEDGRALGKLETVHLEDRHLSVGQALRT